MFTIDKDNTCYKRLLHKWIKIHLSCSLKLNLRGLKYPDNSPEYRKRKCEQTGDYETEVSCWMVRGSSGTLELFHYCPCQGTRTLLFPSPLTSPIPIHALPNEEPHLICLLSELVWFSEIIGFPCGCVIALKNNTLMPERSLYNEAGPPSLGSGRSTPPWDLYQAGPQCWSIPSPLPPSAFRELQHQFSRMHLLGAPTIRWTKLEVIMEQQMILTIDYAGPKASLPGFKSH